MSNAKYKAKKYRYIVVTEWTDAKKADDAFPFFGDDVGKVEYTIDAKNFGEAEQKLTEKLDYMLSTSLQGGSKIYRIVEIKLL